jgi:tRNA(fMet)-specific endonuclease VapC
LRIDRLPWDWDAAQYYARVRAALEPDGEVLGNLDLMIAAHALAAQAVLVTRDRVFQRVRELRIEDWSKP